MKSTRRIFFLRSAAKGGVAVVAVMVMREAREETDVEYYFPTVVMNCDLLLLHDNEV
jgi:hypothetical protein